MDSGKNAHLDALKNRYRRVLDAMPGEGIRVEDVRQDGAKLLIKAVAPSDQAKNKIWDLIKQTPTYTTDLVADIRVEASAAGAAAASKGPGGPMAAQAGNQSYTVAKGDTLSKIAKQFYGDAGKYQQIFEANKNILKDPDKIQVGQTLVIPPAK